MTLFFTCAISKQNKAERGPGHDGESSLASEANGFLEGTLWMYLKLPDLRTTPSCKSASCSLQFCMDWQTLNVSPVTDYFSIWYERFYAFGLQLGFSPFSAFEFCLQLIFFIPFYIQSRGLVSVFSSFICFNSVSDQASVSSFKQKSYGPNIDTWNMLMSVLQIILNISNWPWTNTTLLLFRMIPIMLWYLFLDFTYLS